MKPIPTAKSAMVNFDEYPITPVRPPKVKRTSDDGTVLDEPPTSDDESVKSELATLRKELRQSRAYTQNLELKLKQARRSIPAPFGSSQPTTGTYAALALEYPPTTRTPSRMSNGREPHSPIHSRPASALSDTTRQTRLQSSITLNGSPWERPVPSRDPSLTSSKVPTSPSEDVDTFVNDRWAKRPFAALSPSLDYRSTRIPVSTVGTARALTGGQACSPQTSPKADGPSSSDNGLLSSPGPVTSSDRLAPGYEPKSSIPRPSPTSPIFQSSPFFGNSSSGDRHAARMISSSTGTGKVLSDLQVELASLRGSLDSTKGQLRVSQRAVEALGRQVEEQKDSRERLRVENEATCTRLARKERILEELLSRAQKAESDLSQVRDSEKEAKARAKSMEAGTADAIARCERAEREYDALRSGVSSLRSGWKRDVEGLTKQLEEVRSHFAKEVEDAKLKHHSLVKIFQTKSDGLSDIQKAISARRDYERKRSEEIASLSDKVRQAVKSSEDGLSEAQTVSAELRRLRRLIREHGGA